MTLGSVDFTQFHPARVGVLEDGKQTGVAGQLKQVSSGQPTAVGKPQYLRADTEVWECETDTTPPADEQVAGAEGRHGQYPSCAGAVANIARSMARRSHAARGARALNTIPGNDLNERQSGIIELMRRREAIPGDALTTEMEADMLRRGVAWLDAYYKDEGVTFSALPDQRQMALIQDHLTHPIDVAGSKGDAENEPKTGTQIDLIKVQSCIVELVRHIEKSSGDDMTPEMQEAMLGRGVDILDEYYKVEGIHFSALPVDEQMRAIQNYIVPGEAAIAPKAHDPFDDDVPVESNPPGDAPMKGKPADDMPVKSGLTDVSRINGKKKIGKVRRSGIEKKIAVKTKGWQKKAAMARGEFVANPVASPVRALNAKDAGRVGTVAIPARSMETLIALSKPRAQSLALPPRIQNRFDATAFNAIFGGFEKKACASWQQTLDASTFKRGEVAMTGFAPLPPARKLLSIEAAPAQETRHAFERRGSDDSGFGTDGTDGSDDEDSVAKAAPIPRPRTQPPGKAASIAAPISRPRASLAKKVAPVAAPVIADSAVLATALMPKPRTRFSLPVAPPVAMPRTSLPNPAEPPVSASPAKPAPQPKSRSWVQVGHGNWVRKNGTEIAKSLAPVELTVSRISDSRKADMLERQQQRLRQFAPHFHRPQAGPENAAPMQTTANTRFKQTPAALPKGVEAGSARRLIDFWKNR